MFNQSFGRRSINLSQLSNIEMNPTEIFCKWFRGLSMIILLFSFIIYVIKSLFISLTNDIFTIKTETQDFPSSDSTNKNYSYNFTYAENNNTNSDTINDKEFILNPKSYDSYIKNFNLTSYLNNKNKRKKEQNYLYKLFKFDETGEESSILIDYSSSLPHFPLFAEPNDKCYIRGEIISKISNIINLTCIDISGIFYNDSDFNVRFSLLDKNSSEISLFIFKEIKVKNETERKDGRYNAIFYGKNDTRKNFRYCSKELLNFSQSYIDMPKNYIPVIEINWPKKKEYFCLKHIQLFYEK